MQLEITDIRTVQDKEPRRTKLEFHNMPISIGSHSANTVQLPDTDLHAYHGMVLPVGDSDDLWEYRPTAPDAAALINGVAVSGPVQLEDGDVIELSHFEIKFELDVPPDLQLPAPSTNLEELAKIRQYPLPPRADVRRGDDPATLAPETQEALAAFGMRLRSCNKIPQLIELTLEFLLDELGCRTVWMGVRRSNSGELENMAGRSAEGPFLGEPILFECFTYRCLARRQFIRLPKTKIGDTQSAIAVPVLSRSRGSIGLIIVDTKRRTRVFDESDQLVAIVARFIASQLEAIIDKLVTAGEEMEKSELAFLREVQDRFDITNLPQWKQLQTAVFAKAGEASVGDLYDVAKMPNGLAGLLVGRIEGGSATRIAAAMAEVRAAFRTGCLHGDAAHAHLKVYNHLLYDERGSALFHGCVFVINPRNGAAEFSTAGQAGSIIVREGGKASWATVADQPPVGREKQPHYEAKQAQIKDGETLAMFTRGCVTACNEAGEAVGKERFVEELCDGFGQTATAALQDLVADLAAYFRDGHPPDDITLLLAHRSEAV